MYNIAIIGAGVIGVTSAFVIQEALGSQVQVTIFSDKLSPHTTGDVSAGLWTPYLLSSTPVDKIGTWGKATHDFFLKLWQTGFANEAGISLQFVSRVNNDEKQLAGWERTVFGCEKLSPSQLNLLNKEHGSLYMNGFNYITFICEPTKFLPFLMRKIVKNGGKFIEKQVHSFEELADYNFIINCSGLFSKTLCNDKSVSPVRGQICRMKASWQFQVFLDDNDNGNYVIPNSDCVILGGTHQENDFDMNVRGADQDFILSGCYNIYPGLKNAEIIKHQVGLRPGRDAVRLEFEFIDINGKTITIVHNYGHGGSGVTLSYGCALEVSQIITKFVNNSTFISKL